MDNGIKPHYTLASEADQENGIPPKQICTCVRGVDHAPHLKDVPVEIVAEPTGSEKLAQSMIGQRNTGPIAVVNPTDEYENLEAPAPDLTQQKASQPNYVPYEKVRSNEPETEVVAEVQSIPETPQTLKFNEGWQAPAPELDVDPAERLRQEMLNHRGVTPSLWAEQFKNSTGIDDLIDENVLIGWFENAIEAGRNAGYQDGYRLGKRQRS